jgi:hypothetical protein
MLYRVRWDIDIDAQTPMEAAQKALEIHRNPESIATVFLVSHGDHTHEVDLTNNTTRCVNRIHGKIVGHR